MTTDTFVVKPLQFPGGSIGELAVCGTVNDLAAAGAKAQALSLAFVLEEGLDADVLREEVEAIARTAAEAGVSVVTGDTKVVERGLADGMYVCTTGIGEIDPRASLGTGTPQGRRPRARLEDDRRARHGDHARPRRAGHRGGRRVRHPLALARRRRAPRLRRAQTSARCATPPGGASPRR